MASPLCTVNSTSVVDGVDVAAEDTVTIELIDLAGVNQWSIQCVSTDDLNTTAAINATLTVNSVSKTASFTSPGTDGAALIFESKVNNGRDVNGRVVDSYTTRFGVFVLAATGNRVVAFDQTTEGDASHGWIVDLNTALRSAGGGGGGSGDIEGITTAANSGLQGGATSGTPSLSINLADTGKFTDAGVASRALVLDASSRVIANGVRRTSGDVTIETITSGAVNLTSAGLVTVSSPASSGVFLSSGDNQIQLIGDETGITIGASAADAGLNLYSDLAGISMSATAGSINLNSPEVIIQDDSLAFHNSVSAPTIAHSPKTGDTAPTALTIAAQAPYASATGANRVPGNLVLEVGTPTNSGTTYGKISAKLAGSERLAINYDGTTTSLDSAGAFALKGAGDINIRPTGASTDSLKIAIVSAETKLTTPAAQSLRVIAGSNAIWEGTDGIYNNVAGVAKVVHTTSATTMTNTTITLNTAGGYFSHLGPTMFLSCTTSSGVRIGDATGTRMWHRTVTVKNTVATTADQVIDTIACTAVGAYDSGIMRIKGEVIASRPLGGSQGMIYEVDLIVENVGGTGTIIGSPTFTQRGVNLGTVTALSSGTGVTIVCTPVAATSTNWYANLVVSRQGQ